MSNVIPICSAVDMRRRLLCLRGQMVLGYISEQDYRRAFERANGGHVVPFVRPQRSEAS